jgi:hypothetical protein
MAEQLYRVISKDADISQRTETGFVSRKVGDEIVLSLAAAAHFLSQGYVEEVGAVQARRAKAEVAA